MERNVLANCRQQFFVNFFIQKIAISFYKFAADGDIDMRGGLFFIAVKIVNIIGADEKSVPLFHGDAFSIDMLYAGAVSQNEKFPIIMVVLVHEIYGQPMDICGFLKAAIGARIRMDCFHKSFPFPTVYHEGE